MPRRTPHAPGAIRQLPLHLSTAAAPPLEGITRDAVVQLLARLLTSACAPAADREAPDETR